MLEEIVIIQILNTQRKRQLHQDTIIYLTEEHIIHTTAWSQYQKSQNQTSVLVICLTSLIPTFQQNLNPIVQSPQCNTQTSEKLLILINSNLTHKGKDMK